MNVSFVSLCGFRGYRKALRIDLGSRFTIIDGRNGVGKSTIFDAIEFALTGTLGKYNDAKSAGESVADYFWWTGDGPAPEDRYVEVGFGSGDDAIVVRRTQFESPDAIVLDSLIDRLCDRRLAPSQPLAKLCVSSIIRDEQINHLSLDLKEADRYALLREALGASDADLWLQRGAVLVALAKKRMTVVEQEVAIANTEVGAAARRLDDVRSGLATEDVVGQAISRLQSFARTTAPADELSGPVREAIAAEHRAIDALEAIGARWLTVERVEVQYPELSGSLQQAKDEHAAAVAALEALVPPSGHSASSSQLDDQAKKLVSLVALGRDLGRVDGQCPLCAANWSHEEFEHGMNAAIEVARQLSEVATSIAEFEKSREAAAQRLGAATRNLNLAETAYGEAKRVIESFQNERAGLGLSATSSFEQLQSHAAQRRAALEAVQQDLRLLDTLRSSAELERAQRALAEATARLVRAQERFGRARRAEAGAQALHDAARRATGETLDRRLERVLPLMSELYRRLRPHPTWSDIEYSIRGDVRRFLKLQVGEQLNPQFLFSSGQRRATGLAFLLSVKLALAWSRWRSILLDDPVQHIDDFRTVHLAEVLAHLVSEGHQVICSVEDAALADLLCRRLPFQQPGEAVRITLGPDSDGALSIVDHRNLIPLPRRSLLTSGPELAAG